MSAPKRVIRIVNGARSSAFVLQWATVTPQNVVGHVDDAVVVIITLHAAGSIAAKNFNFEIVDYIVEIASRIAKSHVVERIGRRAEHAVAGVRRLNGVAKDLGRVDEIRDLQRPISLTNDFKGQTVWRYVFGNARDHA